MITGIDHLVIAVKDLEAATRAYGELGFTVVPGGRHPVGTYNTLIAFADGSYLELIGFYREVTGTDFEIETRDQPASFVERSVLDISRYRREWGEPPTRPLSTRCA